jgi:hypothetical protein
MSNAFQRCVSFRWTHRVFHWWVVGLLPRWPSIVCVCGHNLRFVCVSLLCLQTIDIMATMINLSRPAALLFLRDSGIVALSQLLKVCPASYLTADVFQATLRLVCALTGSKNPTPSSAQDASLAVSVTANRADTPSWAPWFGEAGVGADVPGYASQVSILAHGSLLFDFKLWGRAVPEVHISVLGLLLQYATYNTAHVRASVTVRSLLESLRTLYYYSNPDSVAGGEVDPSPSDTPLEYTCQPGLEPRPHALPDSVVQAMRRHVLDMIVVLINHARVTRSSATHAPDIATYLNSPTSGDNFSSGNKDDGGYSGTVGPILGYLQARVPSAEALDVLEKLLTLLPLRHSVSRGSAVFTAETVSNAASAATVRPFLTGLDDVDPLLLQYLSQTGDAIAVWSLLQRDCEPLRLLALRFISRYELLQRSIGTGFEVTTGHAVFLYRCLIPYPVTLPVYRAVFALLIGADASDVVQVTTSRNGNGTSVELPDPIATLPVRHAALAPYVWKLLSRSEPRVQTVGLRDWSCLLLGMDDGGESRSSKVALDNRETVKSLPDWMQWFLGMALPESLRALYEPLSGHVQLSSVSGASDRISADKDSQMSVVVAQLCTKLKDSACTVPVRTLELLPVTDARFALGPSRGFMR